jgi:hypothetical protein
MPNTNTNCASFPLAAVVCAAALHPVPSVAADTAAATARTADAARAEAAGLRAGGPAALDRLLARYDKLAPGAERDALAATIDAVAAQRYATVSRLYWYTDLAAAQAAARAAGRPILALRMLGRLDEDLSCANSRLFRATLYANQDVARFLRDNFVLYWSSERPVPKVTIDFGDGRRLERTITGNSAHYVLDEGGHVLDVLPGLYAPVAFRAELERCLALHASLRGVAGAARARTVAAYHAQRAAEVDRAMPVAAAPSVVGARALRARSDVDSALARAQAATTSKAVIEVHDLLMFPAGFDPGQPPSDADVELWASMGQALYDIGDPALVLDAASRRLVEALHNATPNAPGLVPPADAAAMTKMINRLQQHIVADTARAELQLRPRIARYISAAGGDVPFERLNAWIYAEVFHTPRADAWLGLLPRTDFTGLPADGAATAPLPTGAGS